MNTIKDLRSSWYRCTNAILHDVLIPGVSSAILIARVKLMLARRYRCLARAMLGGPGRQEVLVNTHRQIREVSTYITTFMEDLATLSSTLTFAEQPAFVGDRFLTLFKPTVDVLLGQSTGPVPGGLTAADLPPVGEGAAATPAPAQPAAKRSILRNTPAAAVTFAASTAAPREEAPAPALVPQAAPEQPSLPWPTSWPYEAGPPGYPYPAYPPMSPSSGPAYQPPASRPTPPSAGASPAARVKTEPGHPPINEKSAARRDQGHPTTLMPQHAWVTGQDCATYLSGAMHPRCHRCPKLPICGTAPFGTTTSTTSARVLIGTAPATRPSGTARTSPGPPRTPG